MYKKKVTKRQTDKQTNRQKGKQIKNTQRHKGKQSQKRGEGQDIGKNSLIIQEDYKIHEKCSSNKFAKFFSKSPNTFAKKFVNIISKNFNNILDF